MAKCVGAPVVAMSKRNGNHGYSAASSKVDRELLIAGPGLTAPEWVERVGWPLARAPRRGEAGSGCVWRETD